MDYRDFPKGDARRYFVVLLAIDGMKKGEATVYRVATAVGCTRAEAQRAILVLCEQFGVTFDRDGSSYTISSWGALKKSAITTLANSPINDTKTA